MSFINGGSFPASIVPSQKRMTLRENFLSFDDAAGGNFAQQYLPELYEAEVERYGNRTIGGFLRMVGAEMPMTSDQVIWSEQNRLHIAYKAAVAADTGANSANAKLTIDLAGTGTTNAAVRVGQTVLFTDNATGLVSGKGLVQALTDAAVGGVNYTNNVLNISVYGQVGATPMTSLGLNGSSVNLFVYGSDFGKGTVGMEGSIEPSFTQYQNSPIIIKDNFKINGSDAAQIGWVEVATEEGQSGYLWYLKSESETRLRFEDYLEMAMVEGEIMNPANITNSGVNFDFGPASTTQDVKGTEGLFAAIEARGNVYSGFAGAAAPGSGALGDFDEILKNLDKQGAIEENMLFLSRATALDFDDMIGAMAGSSYASTASASYGLFENDGDMALNFGFSGFRRGSYDFYKTDWKYLNDASTRGLSKEIDGVMVPAGTTTVYDQMLGSNIRRPFLHVRYRASETEDRRMKSWITGSVGGAYTDTLDAMTVSFLSERCLVTQAANNFVLFKGA
jgi:hypothetical protein